MCVGGGEAGSGGHISFCIAVPDNKQPVNILSVITSQCIVSHHLGQKRDNLLDFLFEAFPLLLR